jgi:hypothetical protein
LIDVETSASDRSAYLLLVFISHFELIYDFEANAGLRAHLQLNLTGMSFKVLKISVVYGHWVRIFAR